MNGVIQITNKNKQLYIYRKHSTVSGMMVYLTSYSPMDYLQNSASDQITSSQATVSQWWWMVFSVTQSTKSEVPQCCILSLTKFVLHMNDPPLTFTPNHSFANGSTMNSSYSSSKTIAVAEAASSRISLYQKSLLQFRNRMRKT